VKESRSNQKSNFADRKDVNAEFGVRTKGSCFLWTTVSLRVVHNTR